MAQKSKQWAAIIMMIALFAMIAFVTNLCSPMATIVKNQFGASEALAQIGNYGNFIAYLVMGIPSGMLIAKFGYKKTALMALVVGIVGILLEYFSGIAESFLVYLIGAFISGFCMCMLNTVVNPLLNVLGGGGKSGNQLIQIGGAFNSSAAVAVYIIMGALIGEVTKETGIADAAPALFIALAIFVIAFIVLLFTKIEEPEQAPVDTSLISGALKHRHFALGALAIFLYMSVEVGTPTYMLQYLTAPKTEVVVAEEEVAVVDAVTNDTVAEGVVKETVVVETTADSAAAIIAAEKTAEETEVAEVEIAAASEAKPINGMGMNAGIVGLIVAVYWLMMFVGRTLGGVIGGMVSSRVMITATSILAIALLAFGMFAPTTITVSVPGVDWGNLAVIWAEVPVGIFAFILVGLCTSVMWGGIFNMAVEGLGKYTAVASGIFMTMVFGCAVMLFIQATVAELANSYLISYIVPLASAAYILFYALIGSRVSKREE